MKRYLTLLFVLLAMASVIIGLRLDVRWNGIVAWGFALIFLIFAAYFTRHISNKNRHGGEIMKYFAVFLPMKDIDKSKQYRPDHLKYLQEMRDKGRILQFGTLVDGAGGLIIYQGNNLEEVTAWAEADPYVQLGARDCDIHEWAMQTDYTISK